VQHDLPAFYSHSPPLASYAANTPVEELYELGEEIGKGECLQIQPLQHVGIKVLT